MLNAELYSPCQLTLTCLRCGDGCRKNIKYFEFLPEAHTVAKPDCNVIFYIFAEFPPSFAVAKRSADMMSCVCGGDIIYDEGRAGNVPINYNVALLQLFYKLNILLKFLEFCCIIKKGVGDSNARQDFLTVFTPAVMPSLLYSQAEMPSL